jgi:hypothetical protein
MGELLDATMISTADQEPGRNNEHDREWQSVADQKQGKAGQPSLARGLETRQGSEEGRGEQRA